MKITISTSIVAFILLLSACNEGPLMNDNAEIESTEENLQQIKNPNPIVYNESGELANQQADKQTIKDAAEKVPDVHVQSVDIDEIHATVTVKIDESLPKNDELEWIESIESAIEGAIQKYQIEVIVK